MEKEFEIDQKHQKSSRFDNQTRSKLLRKALGEGFFMNTARRVPNLKEGTYLTVNEGSLVKADRSTSFGMQEYYPDWAIYTEISGTSSSSGSG